MTSAMRFRHPRGLGLFIVLFALLITAWGAYASILPPAAWGQGPSPATAYGSGVQAQDGSTPYSFSFSASGVGNATGTMSFVSDVSWYTAEVRCLGITGNRATITGAVTESSFPEDVGYTLQFFVEDEGAPGAGKDRLRTNLNVNPPPPTCDPNATPTAAPTIASGEIVVRNATADDLPTRSEQCKNGGWKAFSTGTVGFKNQGDCVAFVATGGENQPSG